MSFENLFINKYQYNNRLEDRLLRIRTFNAEETGYIFDLENTLFFDNYGNVRVIESTGNEVLQYKNPAANKSLAVNLSVNKVDITKRQNPDTKKPYTIIYSPNLRWILYKTTYKSTDFDPFVDENVYEGDYSFLLFNFFHTAEFKEFYKVRSTDAVGLFQDYCIRTEGLDPLCSCMDQQVNREICASRLLPKSIIETQRGTPTYNTFSTTCQHIETGCKSASAYPDSFINQYYIDFPRPTTVTVTLCAMSFGAGGNININKANISQQCAASGDNSIGATLVDGVEADGSSTVGRPSQVGPKSKIDKEKTDTDNKEQPKPEEDVEKGFFDSLGYSENKTAYHALGVVLLVLVIGGLLYKKKQSIPVPVPPST